ncbi:MAG: PQQ-dependent sugar dehydrogenase [bacterium]|nr:PQQ-dependent sugar dehydrogenase [bacterium]
MGEDPGGKVTGGAPDGGSGGNVEEGARSDGGGTPPTGSGAAAGTADAADAAGGAGDPGPAPPITPPGPRFPEPQGVSLTRLAELPVPLAVAFRTQEPGALYVALRHGEVVRLRGDSGRVDSSATLSRDAEAVLDTSARVDTRGEMGLLGLTFSPAGDRLYTSSVNRRQVSELWEWPVAADGRVDAGGGRLVLSLEQPFSNHNGGDVTFGPDGYLYLGFGDGGGGGDPLRAGQDPHDWLGTILRIDPRPGPGGEPYTVPAGNPFADGAAGAPEVWVWGARNPWRFSFDRITGDLWVSDVGQDLLEEINRLPAGEGGAGRGANLGWSDYEGSVPFWSNTEPPGHVRPIVEYRHGADSRCSVTGGYVYRGGHLPGLTGVYLFSDYCDGTVWGYNEVAGAHPIPLATGGPPGSVLSFGEGPDGEIYVLTPNGLWRLEPSR